MVINPTLLAQRSRQSVNWADAQKRVVKSYRDWIRAAPEIQTMYSLDIPIAQMRTRIRQEFERHRFVKQISVVDVLLTHANVEFQETLNYWKQLPHVLKYFRAKEDRKVSSPNNFVEAFLEGRN
ncbi:unnamed protein product [Blumeria hordei]|uniref:Uncharacterized protein n=2 Tax=Blumeria hordei TaxID=2867405 RepID=A0A383UVY0_BLUHO|nr:NADH-ubiquinone oxidoreductase 14.8 kDa subunit [Blumeria hordei DH14]SZF04067.1 unnamed protein product [Blumeria hordei]